MLSFPALAADTTDVGAAICAGDVELGFSASFVQVDRSLRGTAGCGGGLYVPLLQGLGSGELVLRYRHLRALDELEILGGMTWQPRHVSIAVYPYAGVLAGVRQEWIGSFATARTPLGIQMGARILISESSLIRCGLHALRVLGDPVEDFTEWEFVLGIALLIHPK
jgi:hypothetical protein